MAKHRISSIIIVDRNGLPTGIVTDRDLREKVVARGRDVNDPVKDIMNLPLIRVDAKDYCFEAVLKMIKHNIHHIVVIKDGALRGVLTNHDLMMLQGTSPLSFAKDLESQQTIEGLVPVSSKINRVVGLLLKEGARAGNITKILTELNDRLVKKVLEIAEKKLGRPPVPYCWIAFGSEGRKEQTFKTDQDNAIIYAGPGDAGAGRGGQAVFCRVLRLCPGKPAALRLPALPGKLHGKQSQVAPAAQDLEEDTFRPGWPNPHRTRSCTPSSFSISGRSTASMSLGEQLRDHLIADPEGPEGLPRASGEHHRCRTGRPSGFSRPSSWRRAASTRTN